MYSEWLVKKNHKFLTSLDPQTSTDTDALNPDRIKGQLYELVYRDDNKTCPKAVSRCEQCRVAFNNSDIVLVKTAGVRERTDKSGKIVKHTGNVYLHYLTKCLRSYDQQFSFNAITVKRTLSFLPAVQKNLLTKS